MITSLRPPHELLECSDDIKHIIGQLWVYFKSTRSRVAETVSGEYFNKKVDVYVPRDDIQVYFVDYPARVFMYVHPNTVIISVLDEFNSRNSFVDYVQQSLNCITSK